MAKVIFSYVFAVVLSIVASTFVSSTGYGADFVSIKSKSLKRESLEKLVEVFNSQAGTFDDAYARSLWINNKSKHQTWKTVVQQSLQDPYLEQIKFDEVLDKKYKSIKKLVGKTIDNADYITYHATQEQIESMKCEITDALFEALSSDSALKLYFGSYSGDFDMDFVFLTIVDPKNYQMVTLAGGYSE